MRTVRCMGVLPSGLVRTQQRRDGTAAAFDEVDEAVQAGGHGAEHDDGGEHPGGVDRVALDGEQLAEPGPTHDHLADDGAGDRQGEAVAEAGQHVRQGQRQFDVAQERDAARAVHAGGVDDLGVHVAQPDDRRDEDREEYKKKR